MESGDSAERLVGTIKDAFGSWRFDWRLWLELPSPYDEFYEGVDCREWPTSRWSLSCDWIMDNIIEPSIDLNYYAEVWRALLPPMMVCKLQGASFDEHIWFLTLGLSYAGVPRLATKVRGWPRPENEGLYFASVRMSWMTREQLDVARMYLAFLDESVLGSGRARRVQSVLERWDSLVAEVERRRALRG